MSVMDEKTFCVICEKDVDIVKVIIHGNYDKQILNCNHIGRKLNLSRMIEKGKLPCINRL